MPNILKFYKALDLSVKELKMESFLRFKVNYKRQSNDPLMESVDYPTQNMFNCNSQKCCFENSYDRKNSSLGKYPSVLPVIMNP